MQARRLESLTNLLDQSHVRTPEKSEIRIAFFLIEYSMLVKAHFGYFRSIPDSLPHLPLSLAAKAN